jgi:branched-chain amino acid transport system substrate-binding protein
MNAVIFSVARTIDSAYSFSTISIFQCQAHSVWSEDMSKRAYVTLAIWLALAQAANAQIKVGVAGPLTGPSKAFGRQFKIGASQAIEDFNSAGGILGQRLVADYADDAADVVQGAVVANDFVSKKINYVIGHFNSDVTLLASRIYEPAGILEITPSSTNSQITERGMWNIFRTCGRDDQQGEIAGIYIIQHFIGKNIAIVHNKTSYGQGLAEQTRSTMNLHGMKEVIFDTIDVGQTDYSDLIAKLKDLKVDLIYVAAEHTEAALLLRQMRSEGVGALMMGGDGFSTEEFAVIAGPAAKGTLMTFSPDPRRRPEAKDVVERFRAKRIEPEAFTLYSYAAMQVIKQAAEIARTADTKTVASTIITGARFKTVVGDLSYNKKGDITRYDYVMYVWQPDAGGKLIYTEIR